MSLSATVRVLNGRPVLTIDQGAGGTPTPQGEFWCYGLPNAIRDFAAGDVRICQFSVTLERTWWIGPGQYDFAALDGMVGEFVAAVPNVLLIPRVSFGYKGEGWWAAAHPDELSVARRVDGTPADYTKERVHPVDCWQSAGSEAWTRAAGEAMGDFVRHCEQRWPDHILGYHLGGGISTEWFRWWNFVADTYEDYSNVAAVAFRDFLRRRYETEEALRAAWQRKDVSFMTAAVPAPARLHTPARGFFRDPSSERDVIDWLECLSALNTRQLLGIAHAAKEACARQKIVGSFYGYLWPHWNTQNPARSGHLNLTALLESPDLDYISAPYHYDNRGLEGFHHSQTVPEAVTRAGKLFVDEIDTATHLVQDADRWPKLPKIVPEDGPRACQVLRRDAAAVLGNTGIGWWMDLFHHRWYADECIAGELRGLQALARQVTEWSSESQAEVALVIDDQSYAYTDLQSNLNQYLTSLSRQTEWSGLGFPVETLLLREVARARPYKFYLFVNAWHVSSEERQRLHVCVRRPGVTAIWLHGAGLFGSERKGPAAMAELIGVSLAEAGTAIADIELVDGVEIVEDAGTPPRGSRCFGVSRVEEVQRCIVGGDFLHTNMPSPLFAVQDPQATVLGRYAPDGSVGLAERTQAGWTSIYCGAPLLPGWLLGRIARRSGVHVYAPPGCAVHHRGPLLSVYAPQGGEITVKAPPGMRLAPLAPGAGNQWEANAAPQVEVKLEFRPRETWFFMTGSTPR